MILFREVPCDVPHNDVSPFPRSWGRLQTPALITTRKENHKKPEKDDIGPSSSSPNPPFLLFFCRNYRNAKRSFTKDATQEGIPIMLHWSKAQVLFWIKTKICYIFSAKNVFFNKTKVIRVINCLLKINFCFI